MSVPVCLYACGVCLCLCTCVRVVCVCAHVCVLCVPVRVCVWSVSVLVHVCVWCVSVPVLYHMYILLFIVSHVDHHRSDEYAHAWQPLSPRRKLAHSRSTKDNKGHGSTKSSKSKSSKSLGPKVLFATNTTVAC